MDKASSLLRAYGQGDLGEASVSPMAFGLSTRNPTTEQLAESAAAALDAGLTEEQMIVESDRIKFWIDWRTQKDASNKAAAVAGKTR